MEKHQINKILEQKIIEQREHRPVKIPGVYFWIATMLAIWVGITLFSYQVIYNSISSQISIEHQKEIDCIKSDLYLMKERLHLETEYPEYLR